MTKEVMDLTLEVAQGNPGAMTVIRELMWFSKWNDMMQWLNRSKYKGPELWALYKDRFHQSTSDLGKWIEEQIRKERDSDPIGHHMRMQIMYGMEF